MSFAAIELKMMYVKRAAESKKAIHIFSSAYKATFTWNNMRTLQVSSAIIYGYNRSYGISVIQVLLMHELGMS